MTNLKVSSSSIKSKDSRVWYELEEEYKQFTGNKKELDLLENGAKSLAESWHLQAMYNKWKRIKGISDEHP